MVRQAMIGFFTRTAIALSLIIGILEMGVALVGQKVNSGNTVIFIGEYDDLNMFALDTDRLVYQRLGKTVLSNFGMSPNGQKIFFADEFETAQPRTIIMDLSATYPNQRIQTRYPGTLVWSPDSRQVAFLDINPLQIGYKHTGIANNAVFVEDADGGGRRQLTNDQNTYTRLFWSPDQTQIAAVVEQEPMSQIFIVPTSGGRARLLATITPFQQNGIMSVAWSPEGKNLRFLVVTPGFNDPRIYIEYGVDADGSHLRTLAEGNTAYIHFFHSPENHDPPPVVDSGMDFTGDIAWSADDGWIAYKAYTPHAPKSVFTGSGATISFNTIVISRADGSDERIFSIPRFHILTTPIFLLAP